MTFSWDEMRGCSFVHSCILESIEKLLSTVFFLQGKDHSIFLYRKRLREEVDLFPWLQLHINQIFVSQNFLARGHNLFACMLSLLRRSSLMRPVLTIFSHEASPHQSPSLPFATADGCVTRGRSGPAEASLRHGAAPPAGQAAPQEGPVPGARSRLREAAPQANQQKVYGEIVARWYKDLRIMYKQCTNNVQRMYNSFSKKREWIDYRKNVQRLDKDS